MFELYSPLLQVLQELDVLQGIKRIAGTSGGSIIALLLAIETPVKDIGKYLAEVDIASLTSGRYN